MGEVVPGECMTDALCEDDHNPIILEPQLGMICIGDDAGAMCGGAHGGKCAHVRADEGG